MTRPAQSWPWLPGSRRSRPQVAGAVVSALTQAALRRPGLGAPSRTGPDTAAEIARDPADRRAWHAAGSVR